MAGQNEMVRRQRVLADFGDFVLDHEDLDEILTEGCRLIADGLDTDLAKVIEIEPEANTGLVRAGIGWRPGIVGQERISLSARSSEAYAIEKTQPVITNDIAQETRFDFPSFLRDHGVVALVNVPILLPGRRPWGVLQVDSREVREFDEEDIEFLKTYAIVLGPVIDRLRVTAEREEARLGMAEREEHLRTLLEGVGEQFYVLDRDCRFLFASRSARRVWHKREDELLGRGFLECFPEAQGSVAYEAHRRVMAGRVAENFEALSPVLRRWLEYSITPTSHGGVSVVVQDIHDRKSAEAALRESEGRLRAVLEQAPLAIAFTGPSGEILFRNAMFDELWGRPAHATTARTYSEVYEGYHLDGRPVASEEWAGARALLKGEIVKDEVLEIVKASGERIACWFAGAPIVDSAGSRIGAVVLFRDVSEERRTQAALRESELNYRTLSEKALRESEARFGLLVESVRDYAIFTVDREGIITSWPAGAAAVYGWSEAEMLGQSVDLTFVPEDVATREPQKELETALREGVAPNVREHLRKDGARIFIHGSVQPLAGVDGQIREFIKIGQDVTDARRVQQALADSEQRLRTLTEGIPQLVWRADDEGHWTWSSPQWQACTGQSPDESLGLGWLEAVHPDDRAAVMHAWAEALGKGAIDVEHRVRRAADGEYLWHHTRSLPVRNESGRVVEWLGTSTDVQQLKELQERQAVLVAELQHRTRNLLGLVRSTADKTMGRSVDFDDFRDRFSDRLAALARVQRLLSRLQDWDRVTFDELLHSELSAINGGAERVSLDGPKGVALRSSTVQTFALAIHELATNALKYGALSQQQACLEIRWRIERSGKDGRPWLCVDWRESGVVMPTRDTSPRGGGAGRELIERALPYQLGANTTLVMGPDGVHCTIAMPVSERQPAQEMADA